MSKRFILLVLFSTLWMGQEIQASPISLFWTNCTTEVVNPGDGRINVDNFFSVFNRRGRGESFNPDVGFSVGLFEWQRVKFEAGIDYLGGADDPLYFNTKGSLGENQLFKHAPSISLGILNVGTRTHTKNRTNQNVLELVIGKTFEHFLVDELYIGGYSGSKALGKTRQGFMIGAIKNFYKTKDCEGREYYRLQLSADWQSGSNFLGGGGASISYYFTPNIYLQTGPVGFNTARYNGSWKWSTQIDITFPLFKP